MKRITIVALLIPLFMMDINNAHSEGTGLIGLTLSGGFTKSINGTYNGPYEMSDALRMGPSFNLSIERWIGNHFRTSMGFGLFWMNFKEDSEGISGENPSFTVPALTFRNSYHFTTKKVRPFVSFGAGLYFWRFNTDKPLGSVLRFEGERQQKMSIGLSAGAGLEISIGHNISILIDPVYHYILSKDSFVFGSGFSEQGIVTTNIGVCYTFGTHSL